MKGDELKALDAGCDGYVAKPIDVLELPHTIQRELSRQLAPGQEEPTP
jgi:CheY-like chemotaxis protein